MKDILYEAAIAFKKISEYDYEFQLGNKKKTTIIMTVSSNENEFTHIIGLDHLKDIPMLEVRSTRQKKIIYKKILNKEITYNDISNSSFLKADFRNLPFTSIYDRISEFQYAQILLENAWKGELIKWNKNKSDISLKNGGSIRSSINADYMLSIPIENDTDRYMYFFMYKNQTNDKKKPMRLNIFSAFPSCIDYTGGQTKGYTILSFSKHHIPTDKTDLLYDYWQNKTNKS